MATRSSVAIVIAVLIFTSPGRAATLFAQLGERPGLEKLVETATAIWTADSRIAPTFEDTNLNRFKRLLVDQLCQVTEGGCVYGGRNMHEAHKGLHLDTRQFNILVEDLQLAMDRLELPFATQNRLIALLAPMYRDVVSQ